MKGRRGMLAHGFTQGYAWIPRHSSPWPSAVAIKRPRPHALSATPRCRCAPPPSLGAFRQEALV
jgi:hypothetical protein